MRLHQCLVEYEQSSIESMWVAWLAHTKNRILLNYTTIENATQGYTRMEKTKVEKSNLA